MEDVYQSADELLGTMEISNLKERIAGNVLGCVRGKEVVT